ncbi:ATP-binding protein [Alicyclobacillus tolerans]|uniref:ATP-binding protein n=1 Tax=Alicyclobacillus tolerans TaxID=90970 RepID=UPI003B779C2B
MRQRPEHFIPGEHHLPEYSPVVHTPVGYWEYNHTSQTFFCSAQMLRMMNLPEAENIISMKNLLQTILTEDHHLWLSISKSHANTYQNFTFRNLNSSGIMNWLHCSYETLFVDGKVLTIGSIQELTTLREDLDKSIAIADRYPSVPWDLLQKASNAALWQWDIQKNMIVWNIHENGTLVAENIHSMHQFLQYVHPDDRAWVTRILINSLTNGQCDLEFRMQMDKETTLFVRLIAEALYASDRKAHYLSGFLINQTNYKLQELKLQKKELMMQRVEQCAALGYWERYPNNDTIYFSPELYEIWDLPKEQPVTLDLLVERIHPDDRWTWKENIDQSYLGNPYFIEYRIIRSNGETRFVQSYGEPIYHAGKVTEVYGILQDTTHLRNTEWTLRQNQERLEMAEELAQMGSWEYDPFTDEFRASTGFYRIFEMPPCYILTLNRVQEFLGDIHSELFEKIRENLLSQRMCELEFDIQQNRKNRKRIRMKSKAIVKDDIVVKYFGMLQDVTDQLEAEEALRESQELLQVSEKLSAVGQLAAGVAHEIRNPLTALHGFLQLLHSQAENGENEFYIHVMESELNRIRSILDELLMLAKPHPVQHTEIKLDELVQSVVSLMEPEARLHSIHFDILSDSSVPFIYGASDQIKQVLINLIKNAIESMSSGGVLTIRIQRKLKYVEILLVDQGIGIPQEILDKIGQPFFTTKESGTGLGLMVSQNIIHSHGGKLDIQSEPGVGTAVRVYLPLPSDEFNSP